MILIISLILMTITGAIGALLLKYVSKQTTKIRQLLILGLGGVFYMLSAIINIITLKYYAYSIVYPATAISFIWTIILGRIFLKEQITNYKIIGCILIIIGTYFLTQ